MKGGPHMFDLKKWKSQYELNLTNEELSIWRSHLEPLVDQLLPEWEKLEQSIEHTMQATSQQPKSLTPIVCTARLLNQLGKEFYSMVPDLFHQKLFDIKTLTDGVKRRLLQALKDESVKNLKKGVWIGAGICYGNEEKLQQQNVEVIVSNREKHETVIGHYVPVSDALQSIQQLLEKSRLAGCPISFIPDYYAARFYILRITVEEGQFIDWKEIEDIQILPFHEELNAEIDLHIDEFPVWNVEQKTLEDPIPGKTQRVANGCIRREYALGSDVVWVPIIPANSVLTGFGVQGEYGSCLSVEMPEGTKAEAAIVHPIKDVSNFLSNAPISNHVDWLHQTNGMQPTLSDFQQVIRSFEFLQPLEIVEARLEWKNPSAGELWRRDCIVLNVHAEEDALFLSSRKRALCDIILNDWLYADCRIEE